MKSRQLFHVHPEKYSQLLWVLIFIFLSSPFLDHGPGEIISELMLFYTLIAIIQTIEIPRKFIGLYRGVAGLAFGLRILAVLNIFPEIHQELELTIAGIYIIYLGAAAYWISHDVFENPQVSMDTVLGGISVYLLLGFFWTLLYGIVAILDPSAFSTSLSLGDSFLTAMHFSFTTLTTLGYGDIIPKSSLALVLTNLEAIAGQMYSTVFIAILVGGYLNRRP